MPVLNAAVAALNTLTPADIAVVKTMKSPPAGIRLVCEALCVLKVSWVAPRDDCRPAVVGLCTGCVFLFFYIFCSFVYLYYITNLTSKTVVRQLAALFHCRPSPSLLPHRNRER